MAAGAGLIAWLAFRVISVKTVSCTINGQTVTAGTRVCDQLQKLRGSRLFFRDWERDPEVASLLFVEETREVFSLDAIEKSLAGTITVHLSDSPPLYRMETPDGLVSVSEAGGWRASVDQVRIPLVRDEGKVYESHQEEVHAFLVSFLQGLGTARERVEVITLQSQDTLILRISDFPRVLIEIDPHPARTAARLAVLLDKIAPGEIDLSIRELDMRFELPVLRTFESSAGAVTIDSPE